MKISLNWLKDYVQITESAEQLSEIMSNLGFTTESIEKFGDDTVIDFEITSNRGDCLSHIGIAREIAAATGRELKLPKIEYEAAKKDVSKLVSVEINAPSLCGRYTAMIIEDVKVGPTPAWMTTRLEAIGLRSVNNVVDATNYAMMETGQPPHAFDYDKIRGAKIIVRKAKKGEKLVSIDGTQCTLEPDMLIIADAKDPVAIAGVMGGIETEVSNSTKNILLEDASFSPPSVRTTSRKLSLPSEAAYRFGRIVDIQKIDWAAQRTAQLIVKVAGGKIVEGIVDAWPIKPQTQKVELRLSRLNKLLGIDVPPQKAFDILNALKFEPKKIDSDKIACTVPSWRPDVSREADLIEEVGRVYGYDKVGVREKISIKIAPVDKRQQVINSASDYLNGCGFYEAITTSFSDEKNSKLIAGKGTQGHLVVQDISRKTENFLRSSLIGSLLNVVRHNYNVGNKNIRIYELADVFKRQQDGNHVEHTSLSLVCDNDFGILKGTVCGLIKAIDRDADIVFKPAQLHWAKAGAEILVNGANIGSAGVLNDEVIEGFDIKANQICAAELVFDSLLEMDRPIVKMKPLPKFPAIVRDLSLIVDEQIQWVQLEQIIRSNSPQELEEIKFEGIYRGKPIPAGKKSVTVSLCFRDEDGTLKHEIVDQWEGRIVSSLSSTVGAEIRKS
ncbi:MAG: phenylalanine--tRNA ligase subunit beta [Phycisphaerae bacterium]|nr:phenylalanine--tRNA ligase subunit beta [Phycisphaerae bacterium]